MLVLLLVASTFPAVHAQTPPETTKELSALFKEGNHVYHGQHDRERGLALFRELEARARAANDQAWICHALWKQAQVFSCSGDPATASRLYAECLRLREQSTNCQGTSYHLLLLGNLYSCYRELGQLGEALKIHWRTIKSARADMIKQTGIRDIGLFDLSAEQLAAIRYFDCAGEVFVNEASLRFEAGDETSALALAEKLDRRLTGATADQAIGRHAELLLAMASWQETLGDDDAAEATLAHLISFTGPKQFETEDEHCRARLCLAALRLRRGADPAPLFTEAEAVIARLEHNLWMPNSLYGRGTLASMHAQQGRFNEAIDILDAAILKAREFTGQTLIAELLFTRARVRLDSGDTTGVQADLFEALKLHRAMGDLRAEMRDCLQYVRFLRASGKLDEARTLLAETITRERRFKDHALHVGLAKEASVLGLTPDASPMNVIDTALAFDHTDLQPVELTTQAVKDGPAHGRFTLTNPGNTAVTGTLTLEGAGVIAHWNATSLRWEIELAGTGEPQSASQTITLAPLDQALIFLQAKSVAIAARAQLVWHGAGTAQTAWWHREPGTTATEIAVVDTNLALENPFYGVPLHHFIRHSGNSTHPQNLAVRTSVPCRVELVDADGRLLAIDATGDGAFNGAGDVLFNDADQNGYPDVLLEAGKPFKGVEIYVYPSTRGDEVKVALQLPDADGQWRSMAEDRLIHRD